MSDVDDGYAEALEEELGELKDALLSDTIRTLGPDEPLCAGEADTVTDAVASMMAMRRAAVLLAATG